MNLTNLRLMNEQVIRIYDTDLPAERDCEEADYERCHYRIDS